LTFLSDTISPPRRSPRQTRLFIAIGSSIESVASFSLSGLQRGTVEAPWKSHHAAVLIFFASWCEPCKSEMPKVASYLRHHNEGAIRVVGIDANDQRSAAKSFVATAGVTFPIGFDPDGNVTSGIFNFRTVPETAFVNAKGVVTQVYFGAIPKNILVTGIATLRKTLRAA
jgi:thiol-disulfide isomerase/thioredoxin